MNGQSLLGCSHQDAVNALRSVGADLAVSVCDGFDPSVLSSLEPGSPSANRNSVIRYNSQSSVDRDSLNVCFYYSFFFNKKYALWNARIFPISEVVRNTFIDDIKMHDGHHPLYISQSLKCFRNVLASYALCCLFYFCSTCADSITYNSCGT